MIGPGKYDAACTMVRVQTNAQSVVVIVEGGLKGNGFSVQTMNPKFDAGLPALLETIAAQIRAEQERA